MKPAEPIDGEDTAAQGAENNLQTQFNQSTSVFPIQPVSSAAPALPPEVPPAPTKLPRWAKIAIIVVGSLPVLFAILYPITYFVARDPYAHTVGAQEIDAIPMPAGCSETLREKTSGSFDIHAGIDAEFRCSGDVTAGEAYDIINPHFSHYEDRNSISPYQDYDFSYRNIFRGCYVNYSLLTALQPGQRKASSATDAKDIIKKIEVSTACTLPIFS